jgi:hypothetical protein
MKEVAAGCFFLTVTILVLANMDRDRPFAVALCVIAAALGSFVTSQRTIHEADDMLNYHEIFLDLGRGDWTTIHNLGGGLEVGLPLMLRLLHALFGELSVQGLIFWMTFIGVSAAIGIYAWLIPKLGEPNHFALKLACSVAFVSFFAASHTTRQFLAGVMLLPVLVLNTTVGRTVLHTVASTLLHTTSIVYVLVIVSCRSLLGTLMLLLGAFWLIGNAEGLVGILLDSLPALTQGKLALLTVQESGNEEISNVPDLVRLGMLCALVVASQLVWPNSVPAATRRFVFLGFVSFALLLDGAFIGNRLNHLLLNVGFGLIVMMCLQGSAAAMRVAALLGLAYQTRLLLLY